MVGDCKLQRRNAFERKPSPPLSYIIGANIGDGCTLTKGWSVKLEVTHFDFAQAFDANMAKLFSRTSPNEILVRHRPGRLPMYIVKYSSKQLVRLLQESSRKLLEVVFAFPRDFLQGFFDAEGHVDVKAAKNFQLSAGAENSDRPLLPKVKQLLNELGISSRVYHKRKQESNKMIRGESFVMKQSSFTVAINRAADLREYAEEVGFSIHRKMQKLTDGLSKIADHQPRKRADTWRELYSKVNGEWVRRAPVRLE